MKTMKQTRVSGFTLIEMAIVLVIFGLLLAAFLLPLQAQRELAFQTETEATLENAKKALLGFAQANGRLPCPATLNNPATAFPDGTGNSNPVAGGVCLWQTGFLPGVTLGLQPTDAQGYLVDAWRNRIRYTVTNSNASAFTSPNQTNNLGMVALTPNLRVCDTSAVAGCTNLINLTNNAVAVVYSLGSTGGGVAGGVDENENLNAAGNVDTIFVSHGNVAVGAPNGEFDHTVTWVSPFVLYNTMIQAGQLN